MLHIFILMNFLRKHHLLKDKQKDPTPIKFTANSTFFLTIASQHKISKIGITILSLSQLKLYILQDCKQFKSIYLAKFNSPRKTLQTISLVFLARSCQHKTRKIRIAILSPIQLKFCNLQDRNNLKSIYLATFYSPKKYQKQCI